MVVPIHIWGYAFRIWLAAVVALYAAFWLQLGGASSAAVTVAILAQPTRGAALAKAANRIAATLIGATMSVVIVGLFPGDRIGMLGAFICWICICVFVASYLRGYQAYAAVLSGYTVAIIALVNIDTPQNVFTTMTDRMAAIAIGILCVTLINDVFGSPRRPFADVRAALERSVPHLDPGLVKALDDGDVARANREKEQRPELSIFLVRDHGALLKIAGKTRNALQYDIGNPLTASLPPMRRLQLLATARPQNRQHPLAMFSNP